MFHKHILSSLFLVQSFLLCYGQVPTLHKGQHATCRLLLRGYRDKNITAGVEAIELACSTSVDLITIGINSTHLKGYAQNFTGVKVVDELQCQTHGMQFSPPVFALLYFCGTYSVSFLKPIVQLLQFEPAKLSPINLSPTGEADATADGSPIWTAVLAFGGTVNVSIVDGTFENNSAGSVLMAMQQAAVHIQSSHFINNGGHGATSIASNDYSTFEMYSTVFNGSTNTAVLGRDNSSLDIRHCTFYNNTAVRGAAIHLENYTTAAIHSSNFSSNLATDGGVLFMSEFGKVSIASSQFNNNTATWSGGCISSGGEAEISDSVFMNNTGHRNGGAIVFGGTNTLRKCSFSGNAAKADNGDGGAVAVYGNQTTLLTDILFVGNYAKNKGGGVLLDDHANATILQSAFYNNSAGVGGAFSMHITASAVVEDCMFGSNSSPLGGAGFMEHETHIHFKQCRFENNSATRGGGLIVFADAEATFEASSFSNNTATKDGGSICLQGESQVLINDTMFTDNIASGPGGSLHAEENASVVVASSVFMHNTGEAGGSMCLSGQAHAFIVTNTLINNTVSSFGGGVFVEGAAQAEIKQCTITQNSAMRGGGLAVAANGTLNVTASSISFNLGDAGGGISAQDNGAIKLAESTNVTANTASNNGGGGILAMQDAQVILGKPLLDHELGSANHQQGVDYLIIEQNKATSNNGGGVQIIDRASLQIVTNHCRIARNAAKLNGGGLYASSKAFSRTAIEAATRNNTARFDQDIAVPPVAIELLTPAVVTNFVDRVGSDEGIMSVQVNISGYYGLPCDGVTIVANLHHVLSATDDEGGSISFLGATSTNASGIGSMLLRVHQAPGQYFIKVRVPEHREITPANISLHVRGCNKGEVSPMPYTCQPCGTGFYSLDPAEKECSTCPAFAACPGGAVIVPLPGWWHSAADSNQLHRCPNTQACQGNITEMHSCSNNTSCRNSSRYVELQCAAPYKGHVCGACQSGYGSSKPFNCRPCMKHSVIIGLYILAFALMLVFVKLLCHFTLAGSDSSSAARESSQQPAELLRCLVLYSQRLLLVASLSIEWPATVSYPVQVVAWFWSPSSAETLSIDCVLPLGFVPMAAQRVLFYLSMPVVMLLCMLLIEAVTFSVQNHCTRNAASLHTHFASQLGSTAMVIAFFFLPSMLRTLFGMFACLLLDEHVQPPYTACAIGSFWVYDVARECFAGYHKWLAYIVGLPLVVVLCIGLPLAVVYVTQANRYRIYDPVFRKHFGFLVDSYVPHKCWWESVVACETVVLVAISVFGINTGPFYQCLLMVTALAAMLPLYATLRPHTRHHTGHVFLWGVCCLLLTAIVGMSFLACGSIQPRPVYGVTMGALLIATNTVYVLSVLYELVKVVDWKGLAKKASTVWLKATGCARNGGCSTMPGMMPHGQASNHTGGDHDIFYDFEEGKDASTILSS